jgi:hypothetical protein
MCRIYAYEFIYASKQHETFGIEIFDQLKISRYIWKYPVPNWNQKVRKM